MDSKVVNSALEGYFGNLFPKEKHQYIRERFLAKDELHIMEFLAMTKFYSPKTFFIISLCVGYTGIDRLLLGQIGLGILKMVTAGGFGIWTIVDWFHIKEATRRFNYERIKMFLA